MVIGEDEEALFQRDRLRNYRFCEHVGSTGTLTRVLCKAVRHSLATGLLDTLQRRLAALPGVLALRETHIMQTVLYGTCGQEAMRWQEHLRVLMNTLDARMMGEGS